MRKVLITGARGFIGENLTEHLKAFPDIELLLFDIDNTKEELREYAAQADFVFHLAGINRPQDISEFDAGNRGFTLELISVLEAAGSKVPIVMSSSIQAALDNPYGVSKRAAEQLIFAYGDRTGVPVYVYRLPNVFGKWCRPNYNSAVATFCYNIANDLPIIISDENASVNLVYIDDVIEEFISRLKISNQQPATKYYEIPTTYQTTVGKIAERIRSFKKSREERSIPDMSDSFTKKLYATYLSYLPTDKFSYLLKMNVDTRGSFTEFIRTPDRGQVSINISKPGIVKGDHWHHTKNEKFLVVSGRGVIRFRKIDKKEVLEYFVNGDKLEVVDIPTGYAHNIENLGDTDMVTIMWTNECFDTEKQDTIYLEV